MSLFLARTRGTRMLLSRTLFEVEHDEGTDDASERVHPEPAKSAGEQQAYDDKHRHRGVGDDVNDRGSRRILPDRIPQ